METFWYLRLRFRRAYDSGYDSDFRFLLGHKLSYVSTTIQTQTLSLMTTSLDSHKSLLDDSFSIVYTKP